MDRAEITGVRIMTTPTRRIVPAEAPWEALVAGRDAMIDRIEEDDIDLSTDDATACYAAMLAASPASGKVSEAEVEKAAEALYRCDQDGLRKAASIGMKLVSGAITPWQNLHPENRDGYLIRARAAIAALGLEVEG